VAPPGNQAANGENKPQPVATEETGLLDSIIIHQVISATTPAYTKYYGYFFAMKFNLDICTTLSIIDIK